MRRVGRTGGALLGALVMLAGTAAAQTPARSLDELARVLAPGERVTVTLRDGTLLSGRVTSVEPHQLRVQSGRSLRDVPAGDLDEIRTRGDRLWNGALIGAGFGAAGGAIIGAGRSDCTLQEGYCARIFALIGAPLGAAVGLALDAAWSRTDLLYSRSKGSAVPRSVMVVPVLTPGRKAVRVAYTF